MKQLPKTVLLKMENGSLIPKRDIDKYTLENYLKNVKEGETLQVTYEEYEEGSYGQISKLQVCTRELAAHLGYSHEDVKNMIKVKAGLITSESDIKSFADCSKEELNRAIKAMLDFAEKVDFPLY